MEGHDDSLATPEFYIHAPSIWIRYSKIPSPTSSTSSGQAADENTPVFILLFSWTSASPRLISKYTSAYVEMFPNVPIMVVTTTLADLAFKSERQKQSVLVPAVGYMLPRHLDFNIHLHCFSEGGSHEAIQFAKAYLSKTGTKMHVTSSCMDSTPGDHQYHQMAKAFPMSLPAICLMFAYLMLTSLWVFYAFYGPKKNLISRK